MNFEEMSEKEILDIATPIMDNLMDASSKIDHEAHIRDFTDRMKNIVTKDFKMFVRNIRPRRAYSQSVNQSLYLSALTPLQ